MNSETLLIRELKNGSQAAFKLIYELYAARLYAFGLRYCKSKEVTRELVADTFVWLWNNRETVREVECLRPILFVRMRHFLINAYRSTLHAPEFRSYLNCQDSLADAGTDHWVEYDDFVKLLHRALERMPPTQKRVIELAKLEGVDVREIARRMQLTEQTVRNQLSLGLKKLRTMLGVAPVLLGWLFFVNTV